MLLRTHWIHCFSLPRVLAHHVMSTCLPSCGQSGCFQLLATLFSVWEFIWYVHVEQTELHGVSLTQKFQVTPPSGSPVSNPRTPDSFPTLLPAGSWYFPFTQSLPVQWPSIVTSICISLCADDIGYLGVCETLWCAFLWLPVHMHSLSYRGFCLLLYGVCFLHKVNEHPLTVSDETDIISSFAICLLTLPIIERTLLLLK